MKYTARTNQHGQTDIIRAENAHLPHVYVSWWDGGGYRQACIPAEQEPSYRTDYPHRTVHPAIWVD